MAWYENLGDGNFSTGNIIASDAIAAHSIYAIDLDGDEDMDVLSASVWDHTIAWYENLGNGTFGSKQVINNNYNLTLFDILGRNCVPNNFRNYSNNNEYFYND